MGVKISDIKNTRLQAIAKQIDNGDGVLKRKEYAIFAQAASAQGMDAKAISDALDMNGLQRWWYDVDKVSTDGKDDGQISTGEKVKSFVKGLFGGIVKGIAKNPVESILSIVGIAAVSAVAGAAVAALTAGAVAAAPVAAGIAIAVGLGFGISAIVKGIKQTKNAETDGEAKMGMETSGTGVAITAMSCFGIKKLVKGIKTSHTVNTEFNPQVEASMTKPEIPTTAEGMKTAIENATDIDVLRSYRSEMKNMPLDVKELYTQKEMALRENLTPTQKGIKALANNNAVAEENITNYRQDGLLYNGSKYGGSAQKLFRPFEEFQEEALKRISEYKDLVPEKLYKTVEESIKSNDFELTKAMQVYYENLNKCKTIEEAIEMYPEFADLNVNYEVQLRNIIKAGIPKDVCLKAKQLSTNEEQLNYIMEYFNQKTAENIKTWPIYPEILKLQREIAIEISKGQYSGSTKTSAFVKNAMCHKEQPIRFYLLDKTTKDNVLLSYLRQYYIEGKPVSEISPAIVNGRVMTPAAFNSNNFHFANKYLPRLRSVAETIEKEAAEYQSVSQLTGQELSSAIMKQAWTTSCLRRDFGNETKFGSGWTNVKNILLKRKGVTNFSNSSDAMIDRYLLNKFKTNSPVTEKNPFAKFENPETNITEKVKRFVNNRYYTNSQMYSDKAILESTEFKEFKSQFDIDGMKTSIENLENHYINIFFKTFWTEERRTRFSDALKEANQTAKQNIEINDLILNQALTEATTME